MGHARVAQQKIQFLTGGPSTKRDRNRTRAACTESYLNPFRAVREQEADPVAMAYSIGAQRGCNLSGTLF
jgi:hypothetical protein